MSFSVRVDESVEEAVKRIVGVEMEESIREIDNPKMKRIDAIHEGRKHCKKVRGVLRLVRPQLEEIYQFENAWFRDTAKGLAALRDAEAIVETYDSLINKFTNQIDRRAFVSVRRGLILRRKNILEGSGDLQQKLKRFRARMTKAARRVADWKLSSEEIEPGLVATYWQARKTMAAAYADRTAENFHEWRKHAKYHNYHIRLLSDLWKPVMHALLEETDELSDLLGDDHNLDVLHKTLLRSPKKYGKKRDIQVLLGLIDRRSAELRVEAKTIGERVFAEKPGAFGRRFRGYWDAWKLDVDLPPKKLTEEPAVVTAAA
jgi:CHAD domain-containing protein